MSRIQLTCECCNKIFDLNKTNDIPAHIWKMRCNFCIECDFNDKMTDYYVEWWDEDENKEENKPIPIGDNQLVMPFIIQGFFDDMKQMDSKQAEILDLSFKKSLRNEPTLSNRK